MAVSDPNKFASVGNVKALFETGDGFINTTNYADGSVTLPKLAQDVSDAIAKPKPGKDLGAYTWQELVDMANDTDIDLADLGYLIGQSRYIPITGYGMFTFQLIGIGHDEPSSGSANTLTFQSVDVVCKHNMNNSATTSGGWASSAMRTFMNGDLLSKFPQCILDVIKEVKKPYCATSNGAVQYCNDKLFIASEMEVFGTSGNGNDGPQYEYWSANNTTIARIKKLDGAALFWWTRSVYRSDYFCGVSTDGYAGNRNANSNDSGCVPCFCI